MLLSKNDTKQGLENNNDILNKVIKSDIAFSDDTKELRDKILKRKKELGDMKSKISDKIDNLKSQLHGTHSFTFDIDEITQESPELESIRRLRIALKQPYIVDDEYRELVRQYLKSVRDKAIEIDSLGVELVNEKELMKKVYEDYCDRFKEARNTLDDVGTQIIIDIGNTTMRVVSYSNKVDSLLRDLKEIDSGKVDNSVYRAWV